MKSLKKHVQGILEERDTENMKDGEHCSFVILLLDLYIIVEVYDKGLNILTFITAKFLQRHILKSLQWI